MKLGVLIHCYVLMTINANTTSDYSEATPESAEQYELHISALIASLGVILNGLSLSYFILTRSDSYYRELGLYD